MNIEDVLNKLSDARVVDISVSENGAVFQELCDQWFGCELTAKETRILALWLLEQCPEPR